MHGAVAACTGCALRGATGPGTNNTSSTSNTHIYGCGLGFHTGSSFNGVSVPVQNGAGRQRRVCRRWRVVSSSEGGSSGSSSCGNNGHKRVQPAQAFSKHHAAVNMLAIEPLACSGLQHQGGDRSIADLQSAFGPEMASGNLSELPPNGTNSSNGSNTASSGALGDASAALSGNGNSSSGVGGSANMENIGGGGSSSDGTGGSAAESAASLENSLLDLEKELEQLKQSLGDVVVAPEEDLDYDEPAEMVIKPPSNRSKANKAPKKKKPATRKRTTAAIDRTITRDQSRRSRSSVAFGVKRSSTSSSTTLSRRRVRGSPIAVRRPEENEMVRARSAPVGASSDSGTKEDEEDEEALQRQREVVDEMQMMERGTDQSKKKKVKMGKARDAVEKGLQGVDMTAYLKEISQTKLLTVKEEKELSRYVQRLLQLKRLKEDVEEQLGREISRQEWAEHAGMDIEGLAEELKTCIEAKHKMISANMRLVVSVAKKYLDRGMSFQDLVQEGTQGLVRGTEKFDASKGYKFSTYAHWWIRQAVTRAIADESRVIRLPVHLFEANTRIIRCRSELEKELGQKPSDEEVANKLGMKLSKLQHIQSSCQISSGLMSIDTPLNSRTHKSGEGRQRNLADLVPAPRTETPHVSCSDSLLREDLDNVLNTLSPRERDVVRLRFGLDDGRVKTLEEIGEYFDVTRERIRQIENKAIRKLKQPSRHTILRDYVDKTEVFDETVEL